MVSVFLNEVELTNIKDFFKSITHVSLKKYLIPLLSLEIKEIKEK